LTLKCDEPLSTFAFKFNLRRYTKDGLGAVNVEDWLMLLMRILIVDYDNILFRNRWRTTFGMREALGALRSLHLAPPPPGLPAEHCPTDAFRAFHGKAAHAHPRIAPLVDQTTALDFTV
jgi:hypothetical protein